ERARQDALGRARRRVAQHPQRVHEPRLPAAQRALSAVLLHRVRRRAVGRAERARLRLQVRLHVVSVCLRVHPGGGVRRRLHRLCDRRRLRVRLCAQAHARRAQPRRDHHRLHDLGDGARDLRAGRRLPRGARRRDAHRRLARRSRRAARPRALRERGRDAVVGRDRNAAAHDAGRSRDADAGLHPAVPRAGLRAAEPRRRLGPRRRALQSGDSVPRGRARVRIGRADEGRHHRDLPRRDVRARGVVGAGRAAQRRAGRI
ncbi:MAG: hypothetical protein AVDCRST_MAG67-2058, partial [uncultured Solirubrobacteraceae bacterium]